MGTMIEGSAAAVRQQQTSTCRTCGENLTSRFCSECGEQKFDRHSFSFKHFVHHSAHELFHLDSKIFRTIRYLFTRPAFLNAEYLAGKRSRYVNPLRLYLLCFAIFTLVTSGSKSPLDFKAIGKLDRTGKISQSMTILAHHKGISEETLFDHLNERFHFYFEASKMLTVLAMAGLLAGLYRRQKWYFGEHAVVSLYFLTFVYLLEIVKWPFWLADGAPLRGPGAVIPSVFFFIVAISYLWVILRKLHNEGPWKTSVKTIIAYAGTQFAILVTFFLSSMLATLHVALWH